MNRKQKQLYNRRLNATLARVNAQKAATFISNCIDRYPRTWAQEAFAASPGPYGREIIVGIWRQQLQGLRAANSSLKYARRTTFPLYDWLRQENKKA
jgi:hypothetical protein